MLVQCIAANRSSVDAPPGGRCCHEGGGQAARVDNADMFVLPVSLEAKLSATMPRKRCQEEAANDHSKAERVYRELRRRICEMELAPGSRLRKNEIAVEVGTSRAPINEAIARLAEEGLIDVFPQSGSFIAPIRPQDVRESMLIRTGLEIEAIRRATQRADKRFLAKLDDILDAQSEAVRDNDLVRLDDLDVDFHAAIIEAVDAPRAKRLLDATRAIVERSRFHAPPELGRPKATVEENRRIAMRSRVATWSWQRPQCAST
jgi:GntR family transcriptional regulator, rspAB operon transcriptional repressor